MINHHSETRHTFLQQLRDNGDQHAWDKFVERYRRFIYYILYEVGVPHDDVDDVAQTILLSLYRDLPDYDREKGKFRSWFSALIRHAALAHLKELRRGQQSIDAYRDETPPLAEPDASDLDRRIEDEWTTYVATLAMERVRKVFQGQAIYVFELGLEGYSAEETAAQTKLTVSSVYTLRKRVKKRLYLEIRAITAELEP